MGSVVPLRPHVREEITSSLGMVVFLASWAMMFSALFFAYGYMRTRAIAWPPPGVTALPIGLPAINTVILLASSLTFARGIDELKRGKRKALAKWVAVTFVLGVVFVVLQAVVWQALWQDGLTIRTGTYGSVFYMLTTFHALHVATGLFILLWLFFRSVAGKYTEHNTISVRLCAMFWHFVDVVWILMFLTLYIL